jgi:hypothetical protein
VSSNFETPSHPLPKPVSAYVGLLLAAVEDTREPGASIVARIARMPIATFGQLLTARQRYDELAHQGDVVIDAVVGMVRHSLGRDSGDGDEFDFDDDTSSWAAADFASETAADFASETEADAAVTSITDRSNGAEPAPAPTPLQQLEEFSVPEEIGAQAGGLKDAKDLPLEDFDHISAPQLRGRLRRLDRVQLVQLLDYERAHAHRVPIVVMLENRLAKLLEQDA